MRLAIVKDTIQNDTLNITGFDAPALVNKTVVINGTSVFTTIEGINIKMAMVTFEGKKYPVLVTNLDTISVVEKDPITELKLGDTVFCTALGSKGVVVDVAIDIVGNGGVRHKVDFSGMGEYRVLESDIFIMPTDNTFKKIDSGVWPGLPFNYQDIKKDDIVALDSLLGFGTANISEELDKIMVVTDVHSDKEMERYEKRYTLSYKDNDELKTVEVNRENISIIRDVRLKVKYKIHDKVFITEMPDSIDEEHFSTTGTVMNSMMDMFRNDILGIGMYEVLTNTGYRGHFTENQISDKDTMQTNFKTDKMNIFFMDSSKAIADEKADDILTHLARELKIGIELEKHCGDGDDENTCGCGDCDYCYEHEESGGHGSYDSQASMLNKQLKASMDYMTVSEYGVDKVVTDGSVEGVEVRMVATNDGYDGRYRQIKAMHEVMKSHGYYAYSDCGMHYHLLTQQKRTIPGIVIMNLYQLTRFFSDVLMWITSAQRGQGRVRGGLNEYGTFGGMMRTTALGKSAKRLKETQGGRYSALNFDRQEYIDRDCKGIHIEFRFPDASDSTRTVISIGAMFQAMMLKSADMSRFGVLCVKSDVFSEIKKLSEKIESGTNLNDDIAKKIRQRAIDFINFLKPELLKLDPRYYDILIAMAKDPVSTKRLDLTWEQIEKSYEPRGKEFTKTEKKLMEIVKLQAISATNKRKWIKQVSKELGVKVPTMKRIIKSVSNKNISPIVWDKDIMSFTTIY